MHEIPVIARWLIMHVHILTRLQVASRPLVGILRQLEAMVVGTAARGRIPLEARSLAEARRPLQARILHEVPFPPEAMSGATAVWGCRAE